MSFDKVGRAGAVIALVGMLSYSGCGLLDIEVSAEVLAACDWVDEAGLQVVIAGLQADKDGGLTAQDEYDTFTTSCADSCVAAGGDETECTDSCSGCGAALVNQVWGEQVDTGA